MSESVWKSWTNTQSVDEVHDSINILAHLNSPSQNLGLKGELASDDLLNMIPSIGTTILEIDSCI